MIILRHNNLLSKDLFTVERIMSKIAEEPFTACLDYSLLNKPKAEVYGFVTGIFKRMDICQLLGITISEFLDFLIDVDKGYFDNPYHSFYHAADVAMVIYHMLESYDISEYLTKFDLAASFIAALCHDIGHPGKNNNFQINSNTEMSQKFKKLSVIESHSTEITLDLLIKHNLLRNIESQAQILGLDLTQNEFKKSIAEMILSTDMTCHFQLQQNITVINDIIEFKKDKPSGCTPHHECEDINAVEKNLQLKSLFDTTANPMIYFYKNKCFEPARYKPSTTLLNADERQMLCNILLHSADISNPCRPWDIFYTLSCLVCIEFFKQGDAEKKMGLPLSPNMDYNQTNPSNINVGFIESIVYPFFESLAALFQKSTDLLHICLRNRDEWLKLAYEEVDSNINIPIPKFPGTNAPKCMTLVVRTIQIPQCNEDYYLMKRSRALELGLLPPTNWLAPSDITGASHLSHRRKSEEITSNQILLNTKSTKTIKKRRKSDSFSSYVQSHSNFVVFQQ